MYLAYIFFLFATVSAIPTGRVDVVFPSVETSRSGMKTVKFRALGEEVELKLEPAGDILANDFALYNGNQEKRQSVDVASLRRKLYKDSANGAALLIDDVKQPPSIDGIIFSKLRISPHEWKEVTEDEKRAHRVEELTSDRDSYLSDDIILPDFQREMVNFTRIERDDKCLVIELLFVTDRIFTERYETNEALTEYVTVLSSVTETMFRQLDPGLKFRLLGIIAFTNETEPSLFETSKHPNGDYTLYIFDKWTKYFRRHPTTLSENADLIAVLLARSIRKRMGDSFSIEGVASGGSVCTGNKVCGIHAYMTPESSAGNLAHEIAHSLGVFHDGEFHNCVPVSPEAKSCSNNDGFIMGYNGGVNKGKFSECSKECAKYVLSKLQDSCIYEECNSTRY